MIHTYECQHRALDRITRITPSMRERFATHAVVSDVDFGRVTEVGGQRAIEISRLSEMIQSADTEHCPARPA